MLKICKWLISPDYLQLPALVSKDSIILKHMVKQIQSIVEWWSTVVSLHDMLFFSDSAKQLYCKAISNFHILSDLTKRLRFHNVSHLVVYTLMSTNKINHFQFSISRTAGIHVLNKCQLLSKSVASCMSTVKLELSDPSQLFIVTSTSAE